MCRIHISYILVVLLSYWVLLPIFGNTNINSDCTELFSSEQCEYINALRSAKYMKDLKREIINDVKREISDDIKNILRKSLQPDIADNRLNEELSNKLGDELSDKIFNISKQKGQKRQAQRREAPLSKLEENFAKLQKLILTEANQNDTDSQEDSNDFWHMSSDASTSRKVRSIGQYFGFSRGLVGTPSDRVFVEETSRQFGTPAVGLTALAAIAAIGVGLGIGIQTRQTLQNIDGVEQNSRSAMSLEERLSIAEEHIRLNAYEIDHIERSLSDLTDSMFITCQYLDFLGNAAGAFDCCISDVTPNVNHEERDQFVCFPRITGVIIIPTAETCGQCPDSIGLDRK